MPCFRQEGRNAIVVKQRVMSESRWMLNILHELWHTGEEVEAANWSTIDTEVDGQLPDEELVASQFAGAALLGTNPQKVAEACLDEASRDVRRLKSAVLKIASEWSLPADSVANYLAFRLSHEGTNWWGAAANLQSLDKRVWTITRNKLLEKLDLSQLAESERVCFAGACVGGIATWAKGLTGSLSSHWAKSPAQAPTARETCIAFAKGARGTRHIVMGSAWSVTPI